VSARTKSRKRALDILFGADLRELPIAGLLDEEAARAEASPQRESSWQYARDIVEGVDSHLDELDAAIRAHADGWPLERMPVLALPAWQRFRTQPIDERDVIEMLAGAATNEISGRIDIGGPDTLTYGEMLIRIADLMLISRPTVRLRVNLTAIASRAAAALSGESPELVVPLMEGLQGDLLPADDHAPELFTVRLHSFDAAVEHALADWEQVEQLAAR